MLKSAASKFVRIIRKRIVHHFKLIDCDSYSRFNFLDPLDNLSVEKHFVEIGAAQKNPGIRCNKVPSYFHSAFMRKIMGFAIYQHYTYSDIRIHNLNEIFSLPLRPNLQSANPKFSVDVVVPVYGAFQSVKRCLESIATAKTKVNFRVFVIDDASPDLVESSQVEKLCTYYGFDYKRNDSNLGFVRTANIGLKRTQGNSLLLNSDTIVFDNWLEAFESVVTDCVGTVTCLSNNATIFSIKSPNLTDVEQVEYCKDLSFILRYLNQDAIEIPTSHGFCMLVTSRAKELVGYFDEESYGFGYGEENDYSMRVSEIGLLNLLTPRTVVFHEGSSSFGNSVTRRQSEASRILMARWPNYNQIVTEFVQRNEVKEIEAKALFANLKVSERMSHIHFGHDLGGGVDTAIRGEILQSDHKNELSVWIKPGPKPSSFKISIFNLGSFSDEYEFWNVNPIELAEHLNQLNILEVVVHHQINSPDLLSILSCLQADYTFRIHDYHIICPFNNFVTVDGSYCGEPGTDECNSCIATREPFFLDILSWRIEKSKVIRNAQKVTAPSNDVMKRFKKYFKELDFEILPNFRPESVVKQVDQLPLIGLLGVLNISKGLLNAIEIIKEMKIEYRFVLVGAIPTDLISGEIASLVNDGSLLITGPYPDDNYAVRMMSIMNPIAILFPGKIPETYSFSLDIANILDVPVIGFNIGAIPERVDKSKFIGLNLDSTPAKIYSEIKDQLKAHDESK